MRPHGMSSIDEWSEIGRLLSSGPPRFARATFAVLVLLVAAAVVWAAVAEADSVAKARGAVRSTGEIVRLHLERGGTIDEVSVEIGQRVAAGQLLLRLDDALLRVDVEKNERALADKRREVAELAELERIAAVEASSERRRAQVDLEVARALLDKETETERRRVEAARAEEMLAAEAHAEAIREATRARELAEHGIVSRADLDSAERELRAAELRLENSQRIAQPDESSLELARRQVRAAEEALRVVESRSQSRRQEILLRAAAADAERARLETDRQRLEREIALREVRSPTDGVVVGGRPQPGDVVEAGAVALRIAPVGDVRFEALVPNSEIAGIRVGQTARIKLDAYPYQEYGAIDGRVTWIAPDASPANELSGSSAGFYEIRIELPEQKLDGGSRIELGMAGNAEIVRGTERILSLAFRKVKDRIRL